MNHILEPGTDPQALEDLAASIAQHGVLTPILFRVAEDLLYVVAGERRCEAAKKAGLTEVPAILVEGKHGEIALGSFWGHPKTAGNGIRKGILEG